jgi:hypothetical protein
MPNKTQGFLSNVATTIGSTMGMVAAKTDEFARLVQSQGAGRGQIAREESAPGKSPCRDHGKP